MLVVYRNLLGESHPAAGERPEGMLGGRSGRVEGARSESGAAREQAVIGEVVEGFSQDRRGVHDDLLQRVHRRGARLHRGIPRDLELAHHLDGAVRGLGDGRRLTRQYGPRGDLRVDGVGLDRGAPRRPRTRHGRRGLRHDRVLRGGHGPGRNRRGPSEQGGTGVATETTVERSGSHDPEDEADRAPSVEGGGWVLSAGPRGERRLPVQVDHRGSPSRPSSRRATSRGAHRVPHLESDDRPGKARLVRHRPMKVPRVGIVLGGVRFMHQRQLDRQVTRAKRQSLTLGGRESRPLALSERPTEPIRCRMRSRCNSS